MAVSPGRSRRFAGVQSHRSWRSTRGRVVAGTVEAHTELESESGDRVVFSPPRLILEHGAPLTVPPSFAGDSFGKLAELMRCCDGLQELM